MDTKDIGYVSHIRGNVKKGVDTELGRLTLIVGPNGAGKTSIVNAVELALGAFATDLMGRGATRKPADLMVLSSDGKTLDAQAEFSDGKTAVFHTAKTRTGAKRPKQTSAKNASFPFLSVTENLTGSAAKARSWFLQRIGEEVGADAIEQQVAKSLRAEYADASKLERMRAASRKDGVSEVDILLAVGEAKAKEGRDARAEAKALATVLEERQHTLPPAPPRESELQELREMEKRTVEKMVAAKPAVDSAQVEVAYQRATKAVSNLEEAERHHETALKEAHQVLTDEQMRTGLGEEEKTLCSIRRTLADAADLHVRIGVNSCLLCESEEPLGRPVNLSIDFAGRRDALREANAVSEDQERTWQEVQAAEEAVSQRRIRATEGVEHWQSLRRQAESGPEGFGIGNMAEAHTRIVEQRRKAEEDLRTWEEVANLRDRVAEAQEQEKKAKKLAKECQNVVRSLLRASISAFQVRVGSYLPEGDHFGLEVDPKSDSCRFGLLRDGRLVPALSGAEWARVAVAIGCATVGKGEFPVFIPEERAFDPQTLLEVMRALSEAPGQVILTATVMPPLGAAENKAWTVVTL